MRNIYDSTLYSVDKFQETSHNCYNNCSNIAGRAAQLWRPYDITSIKMEYFCLVWGPRRNDWGTAHGWTGKFI